MYLKLLLRPLFISSALSLACLVGLAAFFMAKPDVKPIEWKERDQTWEVAAQFYDQFDSGRAQKTLSSRLWGLKSAAKEEKVIRWSVIGIIGEEKNRFAIIDQELTEEQDASKRFLRLKLQDSVPGGGTIVEITKDSVAYEVGGVEKKKRLYESSKLKDGKGTKR